MVFTFSISAQQKRHVIGDKSNVEVKKINSDSTSSWGGQIIVTLKCQTEVMGGQHPLVQRVQLPLAEIKSDIQT